MTINLPHLVFDSASYSHDIDMHHRYTQVYIYIYFYQSFHHSSIHLCLTLENNENWIKTYSTEKTYRFIEHLFSQDAD